MTLSAALSCLPPLLQAWHELGPKWPKGFWDDWLREPAQRKGRAFVRPEVSRTYTFGQQGEQDLLRR